MTTAHEHAGAQVFEVVAGAVVEILPALARDAVRPELHLRDLGADSVDRVEIIVTILERLGVHEPLSSFADLPDIAAMVELLLHRTPQLSNVDPPSGSQT